MKYSIGRMTYALLVLSVFGAVQLASAQDSGSIVAGTAVGAAPPAEVAGRGPRLPGLQARNLPAKPGRTVINPAIHQTSVLVVKFRDDLRVRVRNGLLTDEGTGHLAPAQGVLKRLVGASWQPSDRLTEARLDQLRANAQNNLGRAVADLNTQFNVKLPPGLSPAETCDALNALGIVELASPMLKPMPLPLPPDYEPNQGYLAAPSGGINAQAVWNLPGGTGAGIKMADIEYSWNLAHQDLSPTTLLGPPPVDPFDNTNHGTAVLGEIGSLRNTWGTTGIAYESTMYVVAANTSSGYDVGAAITQSLGTLGPGDVILIEQQIAGPNYTGFPQGTQFGLVPVEWYSPWYNRIVIAVGNGVIVVEAAGNGSQNLDAAVYNQGHKPFLPANDSGAIIVGAGAAPGGSDVDRSRLGFSNYGLTVDLQGWGENVTTTGYGGLYSAEGMNQWYTGTFGGTSGASPIVAGACVLLQSSYYALTGLELSPTQVRDTLRATGSPQQNGAFPAGQNIGPRPDVLAARNMLPRCGDGIVQPGEQCDDGNTIPGDGCSASCQFEIVPPGNIVWEPATNPGPWPNNNSDTTTRSLRFRVTAPVTAAITASPMVIEVTMLDLQNPIPPNAPCCPPQNFSAYESATCADPGNCARWVGRPETFLESQDSPGLGNYRAARLQCTPFYYDWISETAGGPITVVGAEILPSSTYSVQTYGASCMGNEATCTNVSAAVALYTRRSGDVESFYNPPDPSGQPNAIDIAQVVATFKHLAGAPVKARAQIQPNLPELNGDISALDISAVVDAVKGLAYSYSGPCPCPSAVVCGATACPSGVGTCITAYGAGAMCVKTCSGGANDGQPCVDNNVIHNHCPGGTCGTPLCRDRCGRCTP